MKNEILYSIRIYDAELSFCNEFLYANRFELISRFYELIHIQISSGNILRCYFKKRRTLEPWRLSARLVTYENKRIYISTALKQL